MVRMNLSRFLAGIFSESRAQLQLQEVTLNLRPAAKLPLILGKNIAQWKSLPSLTASNLVDFVVHTHSNLLKLVKTMYEESTLRVFHWRWPLVKIVESSGAQSFHLVGIAARNIVFE
jgi:hypothetical protein